jgi:hypothetical protein
MVALKSSPQENIKTLANTALVKNIWNFLENPKILLISTVDTKVIIWTNKLDTNPVTMYTLVISH